MGDDALGNLKEMPSPDVALKALFSNNEVFADLFNSTAFDGKHIIDPSALMPEDTAYAESVEAVKGIEKIGKYRDIVRKAALGTHFVVLGIEDADKVHYAMPVRKMLYDCLGYAAECKSLGAVQQSRDWTVDEFLSRLSKGTLLTPIFTMVFYTGEKAWETSFPSRYAFDRRKDKTLYTRLSSLCCRSGA